MTTSYSNLPCTSISCTSFSRPTAVSRINDLYGHAAGDFTLIKIAEVIRSNIREIDVPVRWGGDEFMLLLPNTSLQKAISVTEKLKDLIATLQFDTQIKATASFGVAQLGRKENADRFVVRADGALYRAKKEGRNQVYAEMSLVQCVSK